VTTIDRFDCTIKVPVLSPFLVHLGVWQRSREFLVLSVMDQRHQTVDNNLNLIVLSLDLSEYCKIIKSELQVDTINLLSSLYGDMKICSSERSFKRTTTCVLIDAQDIA
jgi:hypothetical protein